MLDSVRSVNLVDCDISMVEHGRERPVCREGFDIKLFPLERAKVDIRDSISLQYLLVLALPLLTALISANLGLISESE